MMSFIPIKKPTCNHCKKPTRNAWIPLVMLAANLCSADDFSIRTGFGGKLSASMNSVADGKSFRDGLTDLAHRADLNVCIDRRVDPSVIINAGNLGPTVLEAMTQIARGADCVVMPLANVILVGRPEWVDRTALSILKAQRETPEKLTTDVAWDDLTTPSQAVREILGMDAETEPDLPHDLWPKTRWKGIERSVALTLVLAQFDRVASGTIPLAPRQRHVSAAESGASKQVRRRYASNASLTDIRPAVTEVDNRARFRKSGDWLEIVASMPAHRAAIARLVKLAGQGQQPDLSTPFSLNAEAPAKDLLLRLAATVGKKCRIEDGAADATSQRVKIEADGLPLGTLIDRVARQAGVAIRWEQDAMVVSPQAIP